MKRVAVVGAGVAGVASAYLLCRAGYAVTLVDRNQGPALGASRANGAQLSYAYGDALGSPSLLRHLPHILLRRDPAYRVQLQTDPEFLIWGLRFLAECLPTRSLANTQHLLKLAFATRRLLEDVLVEFDLSFDYQVSGKMILYSTAKAFAAGAAVHRLKQSMGIRQEVLDRSEATAIEPALTLYPDSIDRVVYSPDDAAGRPDRFCTGLVDGLVRRYGLRTLFGEEVRGIQSCKGRVTGLSFSTCEQLDCDLVVATTGAALDILPWTDRPVGGIWPVQGYSMTAAASPAAMRVSITDLKRKLVFARLGDDVRIAGLADIGAARPRFSDERFDMFRSASIEAFGGAFEHKVGEIGAWSGARPCTPSSRPIIRPGRMKGLYLNLGHGTLGWTLCLGSAQFLLDLVATA
ncbi:MAG TPA: FAD-dependent oxidoreductase [Pararhizobium sp.]|uniref:FAD-dependent oxidoreductase n=1 Tax=Pararhizobium sp. TaxID=1977563 RepID=UPI002C7EF384|nr:FAD-dependent oxidoreductase [Pararhizobium sp.]HTO31005.1 FAD-dependent oxidoreductase [Pararhizobium sp.]